jgi:hypothetical protein
LRARLRASLGELGGALPLGALALLVANDHLLKGLFHNAVTGKLSDVAICFLMPLLVSAALGVAARASVERRLWIGAAVTAVVFTAMEMSDATGDLFRWMIHAIGIPGGELTRDPTDLLALGFVPLAVAYGRRRARSPRARLALAPAAGAVALIGGALALMATSAPGKCGKYSMPVVFQVDGDCGSNGIVVVDGNTYSGSLSISNGPALGLPDLPGSGVAYGSYDGTSCPFTLDQGEWEVTVNSCGSSGSGGASGSDGSTSDAADASPATDASADARTVDGGDAGGLSDASAVSDGGPGGGAGSGGAGSGGATGSGGVVGSAACTTPPRKCQAAVQDGALWFTCTLGDAGAPLCRSRLTVMP